MNNRPSGNPLRLLLVVALLCMPSWLMAQGFDFKAPPAVSDASVPAAMRDLAQRILPVYEEPDPDRYLDNLSALQVVAGEYAAADDTRTTLRDRRKSETARPQAQGVIDDVYVRARLIQANDRLAFSAAFTQAFRDIVFRLNDQDAYSVTARFARLSSKESLQKLLDQSRAKGRIELAEAVELIRSYLAFDARRAVNPLIGGLITENDRRRYTVNDNVLIKIPGGGKLLAQVVRPKSATKPLPTLLEFTIDDAQNDAKEAAAHGYVGVVAYTRGKLGKRPGRVLPFVHDGDDARAVIQWIARQPWSDKRVGMVGGQYGGFAAWAALKRPPPELKAIATASAIAPGIDFPMAGNIRQNSAYRWAYTHARRVEKPGSRDDAQWSKRDQDWYKKGRPYREFDRRGGKSDTIFSSWLDHPSYDRFWQKMIPYGKQFAQVDIPVLTIAGYYGADAGALYYFNEHDRYNAKSRQTLLVGPYDDEATEESPSPVLRAYTLDTAAQINLRELRYQWFDHVLKGGAKPALLKDRVNYQVMGANEWRHAPSIEGMANGALRFYLAAAASGDRHRLAADKPAKSPAIAQSIKFADRSDAVSTLQADILSKTLAARNALSFVSEPLTQPMEFNGRLSGLLDFMPNKMDMDLNIALYELLANGTYVQLFDPYEARASYLKDRVNRQALSAGKRQQLGFKVERLSSRRLQAGSRVVLVLGINKRPDREINYGAGKAVAEESIADAKIPLKLRWYSGSYIELPIRK